MTNTNTNNNGTGIYSAKKNANYYLGNFDVVFHDDQNSNAKGFNASYEYCFDYIKRYNGTNESYFADYKGGTVVIRDLENGEDVYFEDIK